MKFPKLVNKTRIPLSNYKKKILAEYRKRFIADQRDKIDTKTVDIRNIIPELSNFISAPNKPSTDALPIDSTETSTAAQPANNDNFFGMFDQSGTNRSGATVEAGPNSTPVTAGGSPSAEPTTPSEKEQRAMEYFMSEGWTKEQAAGIVGNLIHESRLETGAQGDKELAKAAGTDWEMAEGIAQWRKERKDNFEKLFGIPVSEGTYDQQLQFVNWELNNTHSKAGEKLREITTAEEATKVVELHYEMPKKAEGSDYSPSIDKRISEANRLENTNYTVSETTEKSPDKRVVAEENTKTVGAGQHRGDKRDEELDSRGTSTSTATEAPPSEEKSIFGQAWDWGKQLADKAALQNMYDNAYNRGSVESQRTSGQGAAAASVESTAQKLRAEKELQDAIAREDSQKNIGTPDAIPTAEVNEPPPATPPQLPVEVGPLAVGPEPMPEPGTSVIYPGAPGTDKASILANLPEPQTPITQTVNEKVKSEEVGRSPLEEIAARQIKNRIGEQDVFNQTQKNKSYSNLKNNYLNNRDKENPFNITGITNIIAAPISLTKTIAAATMNDLPYGSLFVSDFGMKDNRKK